MPAFTNPVFILGAGATKACGGPLTGEILPWAFRQGPDSPLMSGDREQMLSRLGGFLGGCFHAPRNAAEPRPEDFPDLPLLMSLIDDAVDRGLQIGRYSPDDLREVRGWLDFAVAEVIRWSLEDRVHPGGRGMTANPHEPLLEPFYTRAGPDAVAPTVVSFNYDLIADNAMVLLGERFGGWMPDYVCDVATEAYRRRRGQFFGRLLKPHGSLNWMFCPACQQLDLYYDTKGRIFAKAIAEFWDETGSTDPFRCTGTGCRHTPCPGRVRPVLITPTQGKDYRNPHIARVWAQTEQALRRADRAVIIGYSLPPDDVAIISMFKRCLGHLHPGRITVVEYADPPRSMGEHEAGRRYRWLFGPEIDWYGGGFEAWVRERWEPEAARALG
jgi:hypothetical protein